MGRAPRDNKTNESVTPPAARGRRDSAARRTNDERTDARRTTRRTSDDAVLSPKTPHADRRRTRLDLAFVAQDAHERAAELLRRAARARDAAVVVQRADREHDARVARLEQRQRRAEQQPVVGVEVAVGLERDATRVSSARAERTDVLLISVLFAGFRARKGEGRVSSNPYLNRCFVRPRDARSFESNAPLDCSRSPRVSERRVSFRHTTTECGVDARR